VPIGTVDRPREQRRDTLTVNLAGAAGHVVVVGGPRSGKSTLLRTLVTSMALTTTPLESQFFVMDFGGGAFAPMTDGEGQSAIDLVSSIYGTIHGGRWCPRLVFDLNSGLSQTRFRKKTLRPVWNARVRYGRNYTPMDEANLAGTLTAAEREELKREWRQAPSSDFRIRDNYRQARELKLETNLADGVVARLVNRLIRYRFAPGRITGQLLDAPRAAFALRATDEVWVRHPDIQDAPGGAFRVAGMSHQGRSLRPTIDLWGRKLEVGEQALLTDDDQVLTDDSGNTITSD